MYGRRACTDTYACACSDDRALRNEHVKARIPRVGIGTCIAGARLLRTRTLLQRALAAMTACSLRAVESGQLRKRQMRWPMSRAILSLRRPMPQTTRRSCKPQALA